MPGNCSFSCPVLTFLDRDGTQISCSYTSWAYGLAAALLFVGGLLPIGLFIHFCARLKNTSIKGKSTLRRQESDASTFTDVSRPQDHSVYEVLRDDQDEDVTFRTRKGVFPHYKYGTFSVPNLKTYGDNFVDDPKNLYPDLTQVHSPGHYHTSPMSSSSQERYRNRPNTLPSDDVTSKQQIEKRCSQIYPNDDVCSSDDPKCVTFSGTRKTSSRKAGSPKGDNSEIVRSSEVTISPNFNGLTMNKERTSPIMTLSSSMPYCAESPNDTENEGELTRCRSFQPTPPVKHLVEGIDFDLYLKDCVGKLPEDQRNGTFLIRDSQSILGCKVLVIFYRGLDPSELLYHYQICFTEKNEVYLKGSLRTFPTIDNMIDEFRRRRTVLPCLLLNCLGKNF